MKIQWDKIDTSSFDDVEWNELIARNGKHLFLNTSRGKNMNNIEHKTCPFCNGKGHFDEEKETLAWCKLLAFFDCMEETSIGMTCEMFKSFAKSWNPRSGVWVSVSEMMPQDGDRVLVFHDDYVVRIGMAENGEFIPVVNKKGNITQVTHWKPLPIGPIAFSTMEELK